MGEPIKYKEERSAGNTWLGWLEARKQSPIVAGITHPAALKVQELKLHENKKLAGLKAKHGDFFFDHEGQIPTMVATALVRVGRTHVGARMF